MARIKITDPIKKATHRRMSKLKREFMPLNKKKRKPRSLKKYDLCPYCGNANCDPMHSMGNKGPAMRKIQKRLSNKECMGCGKPEKKCSCKSKM